MVSGKLQSSFPFQWIEEQPPPLYEWIDSLSYFTVESWIVESTAERTSLSTLSSLNCQHNFTSSTLNWLVCDCLSDEIEGLLFFLFFFSLSFFFFLFSLSPLLFLFLFLFFFSHFKECENPPPSSKVGFGRACSGLPSTFIIPSTHRYLSTKFSQVQTLFSWSQFFFLITCTDTLFPPPKKKREGCVNVELSFLSRDGYTFIRSNPTVSVKFEDPQTSGIVVNQRGATVGSLVGDGVEIELSFESFSQGFSSLNSVEIWHVYSERTY